MSRPRTSLSPAEEVSLLSQVDRVCPKCGQPLFYKKKGREYKEYEVAHIYPLNPTPEELTVLADVPVLGKDLNDPDNLIPLCRRCHKIFDNPRTSEEYLELYGIKEDLLARVEQQALYGQFPIEQQIRQVIERLHIDDPATPDAQLDYEPKRLADKFDLTMPYPVRRKIHHAVSDYFHVVSGEFVRIEQESPSASQLIYGQVKVFYLKQKSLGLHQPQVFYNIVDWIQKKTASDTREAAEIVTSYFVQNCEVFE